MTGKIDSSGIAVYTAWPRKIRRAEPTLLDPSIFARGAEIPSYSGINLLLIRTSYEETWINLESTLIPQELASNFRYISNCGET